MKRCILVLLVVLLLVSVSCAYSATVRFQQGSPNQYYPMGFSGVQDTFLWDHEYMDPMSGWVIGPEQGYNYGSSEILHVGISEDTNYYDLAFSMMRFTLSAVPTQNVSSARLYLYYAADLYPGQPPLCPYGFKMFAEDGNWIAGTKYGQVQSNSSCFAQKRYGLSNWVHQPGPEWWIPWDFNFTPTGLTKNGYYEVAADIPASMVISWMTSQNAGIGLYGGGNNWLADIVSSNHPDVSMRPALELTIIPEPSSLAALLLGVAFIRPMLKRR